MTSLELDENALMDVLDVPYWVRITSAKCDRVFFQVPFMAIKKVPMSLVIHLLWLLIYFHKWLFNYNFSCCNKFTFILNIIYYMEINLKLN